MASPSALNTAPSIEHERPRGDIEAEPLGGSTVKAICTPNALSQSGGLALGAQADPKN